MLINNFKIDNMYFKNNIPEEFTFAHIHHLYYHIAFYITTKYFRQLL